MNWTDEAVARGVAAAINAGLHDLPLGVVTGIMTATAELLAARGGTMTADALERLPHLLACGSPNGARQGREVLAHLSAQGAQIAAQEQHISALEKSLENAEHERDDALASATRGWEVADAFHVQKAVDRLKPSGQVAGPCNCRTVARPDTMGAHYADCPSLSPAQPSGQVAEDVGPDTLCAHCGLRRAEHLRRHHGQGEKGTVWYCRAPSERPFEPVRNRTEAGGDIETLAKTLSEAGYWGAADAPCIALSRLAAKAQGYTQAVAERDKAWSERAAAIAEKHAAVADNAELVALFNEVANAPRPRSEPTCAWCGTRDHHPICPVGRALANPHPGAALLEQHRKDVEDARVGTRHALRRISDVLAQRGVTVADATSLAAVVDGIDSALERMKRLDGALERIALESVDNPSQHARHILETDGVVYAPVVLTTPAYTARITGISDSACTDGSCAKCRSGEPCH